MYIQIYMKFIFLHHNSIEKGLTVCLQIKVNNVIHKSDITK